METKLIQETRGENSFTETEDWREAPDWGVSWKALEDPVGRLPLTQLGHWLLLHLGWAAGGSSNCSQAKALNVGIGPRKTYGALTSTDPHRTCVTLLTQPCVPA